MNTLDFSRLTAAHWDSMVPQPWQDRYLAALWRARVWLRTRR
jgi:hypothetical protein